MSRSTFTTYNPANGELGCSYDVQSNLAELNTPDGFLRIDGRHNPQTHFVKDGVVTEKSVAEPVIEGLTVSNLPIPCRVLIIPGAHEFVVDDGEIEITSEFPGPYRVLVRSVTHLEFWVTLE